MTAVATSGERRAARFRHALAGLVSAGLFWAGPVVAAGAEPAELPQADFAGQQYVDSLGCLFVRGGQKGWIPRVTRDGVPICDQPPSGTRVLVAGDSAAEKPIAAP